MTGDYLRRRLAGLELALQSRANLAPPPAWPDVALRLQRHHDARVVEAGERVAAVFGDSSAFPRLRTQLGNPQAPPGARKHAFNVLARARDQSSLETLLQLLDDPAFRSQTIPVLSRFDSASIPAALIPRLPTLPQNDRSAALNVLTSRRPYALALLESVASGTIKRDLLTAFHIRQLSQLRSPEIENLLRNTWGRLQNSPAEKLALITRLETTFNEAPLWAYSSNEGRKHFVRLCSSCHRIGNEGTLLGPDLSGAGRNGARYFLENIVDPNAVIGTDFQLTSVETKQGDLISGLLTAESPTAISIRTTSGDSIVPKPDIQSRSNSDKSMMPEGLMESLTEREQIELLKFLTSL